MENLRRRRDYLEKGNDGDNTKSGIYTSTKKDYNPFKDVYAKGRYSFIVAWQISDDDHPKDESTREDLNL